MQAGPFGVPSHYRWVPFNSNTDDRNSWLIRSPKEITWRSLIPNLEYFRLVLPFWIKREAPVSQEFKQELLSVSRSHGNAEGLEGRPTSGKMTMKATTAFLLMLLLFQACGRKKSCSFSWKYQQRERWSKNRSYGWCCMKYWNWKKNRIIPIFPREISELQCNEGVKSPPKQLLKNQVTYKLTLIFANNTAFDI